MQSSVKLPLCIVGQSPRQGEQVCCMIMIDCKNLLHIKICGYTHVDSHIRIGVCIHLLGAGAVTYMHVF